MLPSGRTSLYLFLIFSLSLSSSGEPANLVMYITDIPPRLAHNQGWRKGVVASPAIFLACEDAPPSVKVRWKMREVDPLDLVETIREGLLVLEPDLTIRFASRSFCDQFSVAPKHTVGRKLYELGKGQW